MDHRRKLSTMIVLGAAASALFLAACSSSSSGGSSPTTAASTTEATGSTPLTTTEGTPVAVSVGEIDLNNMYMKVDQATVPAGTVTFTVTNEGVKKHEFVILSTDTPLDQLAVEGDEVVEDDYTSPGEIGDLPAGDTQTLTVDLTPGPYALICNLKGHYRMKMDTAFTVT